jgi:predicted ester cyclase
MAGMTEKDRNKEIVRRAVELVLNEGQLEVVDELYSAQMAPGVREWIEPFRDAFPDVRMEVVELIAEGDKVVARFRCSGTHAGAWRGNPPTGRRFEDVDEVYIITVRDGRIVGAWGIEDTLTRLRQLGLKGECCD